MLDSKKVDRVRKLCGTCARLAYPCGSHPSAPFQVWTGHEPCANYLYKPDAEDEKMEAILDVEVEKLLSEQQRQYFESQVCELQAEIKALRSEHQDAMNYFVDPNDPPPHPRYPGATLLDQIKGLASYYEDMADELSAEVKRLREEEVRLQAQSYESTQEAVQLHQDYTEAEVARQRCERELVVLRPLAEVGRMVEEMPVGALLEKKQGQVMVLWPTGGTWELNDGTTYPVARRYSYPTAAEALRAAREGEK